MSLKNWIKNKTLGLFVKTKGVISTPLYGGRGLVFMLHRVLPKDELNLWKMNRGLAISPEKLQELIHYFKNKGFVFIQMDELQSFLTNKKNRNSKFVALTFDDGYKDNLIHGYPVLKANKVPFTIYITNCFPNQTAILWWYHLENHLREQNELTIYNGVESKLYSWSTVEEGEQLFYEIGQFIKTIPLPNLRQALKESFGVSDEEIEILCEINGLSWAEIIELSKDTSVTIGAHTMNHVSLANQTLEEAKNEMERSKYELEEKIGRPIDHFAYPYGGMEDVSKENVNQAANAGYLTAVLNDPGNFQSHSLQHPHAIQRHYLGEDISIEKVENYLSGITHFANNGFKKSPSF